jgi:Cu(I)/Ag(I) efflux system membrane fusion protein
MIHLNGKIKASILAAVLVVAAVILYAYLIPVKHGENAGDETARQETSAPANPHAGHVMPAPADVQDQSAMEESATEVPTVEIAVEQQKMIGVKVVPVKRQEMTRLIRTVGRVDYNERKIRTVNTKIEGWIEKLHVDYTGRFVRQGEPLADLYSPELLATEQDLINLARWPLQKGEEDSISENLEQDRRALLDAARQRLRLWDISEEQIRQIEQKGTPLRTLTLRSPVSGYVIQKMALQGMRVMAGEKLFDIADLSSLWIIADIYESDLPDVRIGDTATITLSSEPGRKIQSRIDFIPPVFSGETRTAKVRFVVANPAGKFKPQMFGQVEIHLSLGKKLVIPEAAAIDTGVRQVVYVDRGEGNFEPRVVKLGMRGDGYREVLDGLKEGENVAATAAFLIDAEAQLKGVQPLEAK